MIIDSHAHLVAPDSFYGMWTMLEAVGTFHGRLRPRTSDEELLASARHQIALMDEVGTGLQLTSPRPFVLKHSARPARIVHWWVEQNNDAIATQVAAFPDRLRGICALPQVAGEPVSATFEELDRNLARGFVGVLVNPDPSEGAGTTPVMGDEYWYPLYERLVELDVPALLHPAACYGRESYSEHFISEESLAITSMIRAGVFRDFPDLKVIVPHGGGSVPYQLGRWIAHDRGILASRPADREEFTDTLRRFAFDTCLYTQDALELLFSVAGPDRVLFGTERPGSGGSLEDLKPVIEKITALTDEDRAAVFEGNARRIYTRLGVPTGEA
jgi:4-oxalmesaconate hydratase